LLQLEYEQRNFFWDGVGEDEELLFLGVLVADVATCDDVVVEEEQDENVDEALLVLGVIMGQSCSLSTEDDTCFIRDSAGKALRSRL
jgi:hypothetical protein